MDNRNYGIDMLRIISMIMITAFHIIVPGMGEYSFYNGTLPIKILYALFACGVNCFILISGYVNLNNNLRISKIIKLIFECIYYNVLLTLIIGLFNNSLSLSKIIFSLNIFNNSSWWFIKAYLILLISMPLINSAINNLNKNELKMSLFFLLFLVSFCSTFFFGDIFYTGDGFSAFWFIIVYSIGAYIKRFEKDIKTNRYFLIIIFIVNTIITTASFYIVYYYNGINLDSYISEDLLFKYTSPTILINSIILLLLFSKRNYSKKMQNIIKLITPSILSVYLIQCQQTIYKYYFPDRFAFLTKYNFRLLIIIPLLSISIFIICIVFDRLRMLLSKLLKTEIFYSKIDNKINNLLYK